MAEKEKIKEFVAGITFETDKQSQREAHTAVQEMTTAVIKFGVALSALYAVDSIRKVNQHFAEMGHTAERIKTSVASLEGAGRAAELTGSSIAGMTGALDTFSSKMKSLEGFGKRINEIAGVNITGIKDRVDQAITYIEALKKKFPGGEGTSDWARLMVRAKFAGFDEKEVIAVLNPAFREIVKQNREIDKAFGLDTQKSLENAKAFALQWSTLWTKMGAAYKKSIIDPNLGKQIEGLNEYIDKNQSGIVSGAEKIAAAFVLMADAVIRFAHGLHLLKSYQEGVFNFFSGRGWRTNEAADAAEARGEPLSNSQKFFKGFSNPLHPFEAAQGKPPNVPAVSGDMIKGIRPPTAEERERIEKERENTDATRDNTRAIKEQSGVWNWFKSLFKSKDEAKTPDTGAAVLEKLRQKFGVGGSGAGGGGGGDGGGSGPGGGNPGRGEYNVAKAYALMKKVGATDEEARTLAAISQAESGGNPRITNDKGEHSIGLWQINMAAHGSKFGSREQLMDPETNARAALALKRARGNYMDWSVYKHGEYRKFMPSPGQISSPPAPAGDPTPRRAPTPTSKWEDRPRYDYSKPEHPRTSAINPANVYALQKQAPLGHQVANYHNVNNSDQSRKMNIAFNQTINVPGGEHGGASTIAWFAGNAVRNAAPSLANLGRNIA